MDPFKIDTIHLDPKGAIGMCACPGGVGGQPRRDLAAEMRRIAEWHPDHVMTLLDRDEFATLDAARFHELAEKADYLWHHVPVPDMAAPDARGPAQWQSLSRALTRDLRSGHRVLIHCAAGLGRTGTVAASLLTGLGWTVEDAIETVRGTRPGTIESEAQLRFLRG